MTPYWSDDHLTLYGGDCRAVLAELPAGSVHTVVTSPPYWGLRDYGTATWDGGDPACDHERARRAIGNTPSPKSTLTTNNGRGPQPGDKFSAGSQSGYANACPCGAVRIDSQLGLEATPEAYVANMVAVFREVRRVLRDDGTLWLNLGDSYVAGQGGRQSAVGEMPAKALRSDANPRKRDDVDTGSWGERDATVKMTPARGTTVLKPKDLVGIPWRVAFALQADGWYLRSDIIWSKPNPMPESVTDRPTKAHEYLFLLSKSPRYYFDADAVREAAEHREWRDDRANAITAYPGSPNRYSDGPSGYPTNPAGRNLRSVWTIATEPYPGAHFATFPRKLVEPCVKAGTSERGVCPECGAPWEREVERPQPPKEMRQAAAPDKMAYHTRAVAGGGGAIDRWYKENPSTTTGWRPSCAHDAEPVPATVLDPFAGSGTTLLVAQALGRRGVGIDLNPDYLAQALARNAQTPLGLVG